MKILKTIRFYSFQNRVMLRKKSVISSLKVKHLNTKKNYLFLNLILLFLLNLLACCVDFILKAWFKNKTKNFYYS